MSTDIPPEARGSLYTLNYWELQLDDDPRFGPRVKPGYSTQMAGQRAFSSVWQKRAAQRGPLMDKPRWGGWAPLPEGVEFDLVGGMQQFGGFGEQDPDYKEHIAAERKRLRTHPPQTQQTMRPFGSAGYAPSVNRSFRTQGGFNTWKSKTKGRRAQSWADEDMDIDGEVPDAVACEVNITLIEVNITLIARMNINEMDLRNMMM
jgi:hypothetical protein